MNLPPSPFPEKHAMPRSARPRILALAALALASGAAQAQLSQSQSSCVHEYADCLAMTSRGLSDLRQRGTIVAPLVAIGESLAQGRRSAGAQPRLAGLGGRAPALAATGGETGLAGAARGARWNTWASIGQTQLDYEWQPLRSGGDVNNAVLGLDYRWSDKATVGVSLAFDETKIATTFNSGRLTGDGVNVTPYLGYQFDPNWSLDAALGMGRAKSQSVDNSFGSITGNSTSNRAFGSASLNYSRWVGNWEFSGKAMLVQTEERTSQYTLSNGQVVQGSAQRLSQARLGAQVGYVAAEGLNPFVGLAYVNDLHRPTQTNPLGFRTNPANDRDGWVLSGGLNFIGKGALSGGVLLTAEDRREQKQASIMANIAVRF